ncbi:MAG TPA: hypothetical protein VKV57_15655 [bacterium]|nr:hypothetical protein [bacterium]
MTGADRRGCGTEHGSDLIVDMPRALGVECGGFNPGAAVRGLHDSRVDCGGNTRPGDGGPR